MVGKVPEHLTTNYPVKTSGPIPDEVKKIADNLNLSKENIKLFNDCTSDFFIDGTEREKLGLSQEQVDEVNKTLERLKTKRETLEQEQQNQNTEQPTDSIGFGFKVNQEYLKKAEEIAKDLVESTELPEGKQAIPEETEE